MQLLERYNNALRRTEDVTITQLNRILDNSFNRLVRRTRVHMRIGAPAVDRNMALLQEFRQLIPAFNPQRTDAYDRVLRSLFRSAQGNGLAVADEMLYELDPTRQRIDVSIPLEATVAAAAQAKGYLRRHGETFATTATELVAQGVAEGRPTDAITGDLRLRLGVVKSRADVIARTESLRAYNTASNQYYAANGIDLVLWYATADDRTCPICNARAGRIYKRASTNAPAHPRCVLGDTPITTGTIIAATRSWYCGDVITVRTANGSRLRITENHPVATLRGWIPAHKLTNSDEILSHSGGIPSKSINVPDFNQRPPTAEQIFETLRATSCMPTTCVEASPMDFHGEGALHQGDIEIVWADRELTFYDNTIQHDFTHDINLIRTDIGLGLVDPKCSLDLLLLCVNALSGSNVGIFDELLPFFKGGVSHANKHGLRSSAWCDPHILEPVNDGSARTSEMLRQLLNTGASFVAPTKVVQIDRTPSVHPVPVYDFTTQSSTYIAAGLFVHNCRCYLAPWDSDLAAISPEYASLPQRHREEVSRVQTIGPADLNKAGVFEQIAPQPLDSL